MKTRIVDGARFVRETLISMINDVSAAKHGMAALDDAANALAPVKEDMEYVASTLRKYGITITHYDSKKGLRQMVQDPTVPTDPEVSRFEHARANVETVMMRTDVPFETFSRIASMVLDTYFGHCDGGNIAGPRADGPSYPAVQRTSC